MTYAEAVQFLYDLRLFGAKFGLENTLKLAALAGNPQNRLRFVHVAGTNGKGSTCAMLESIYRAAGLRVGIVHVTASGFVPRTDSSEPPTRSASKTSCGWWEKYALQRSAGVSPASASNSRKTSRRDACATFFEVVTVMALKFFAEQKCDLVIWETGLGGRLDATNIVTPLASVITNIAFDHQQWLGDTLAKIAAEKAGIIKPGMPVITATDEPEALNVIEEVARGKNALLIKVATAVPPDHRSSRDGNAVLPLPGEHQKLNAALALATVEVLQNKIPVSEENIRAGLQSVDWPGRLQWVTLPNGRRILLDGAHNVAGAKVLREALENIFSTGRDARPARPAEISHPNSDEPAARPYQMTLILGILQDKDWRQICEMLAPLASRIFTVPVSSERSANPNQLAAACRAANPSAEISVCDSLHGALEKIPDNDPAVIAGSLYLVGEALELLGLSPVNTNERGLNEWRAAPAR